jgi:hypothetical protein
MLNELDVLRIVSDRLAAAFTPDFYLDADAIRDAIRGERMFNMLHLESGIKVDLIVRKSSHYRRVEFERRRPLDLAGTQTWIVSREDLVLSKLLWAQSTGSELQRRDVQALLDGPVDAAYLHQWAGALGVAGLLQELQE